MTMTLEIRGASFNNRGAAMMLIAATQEIQKRIPEARLCVAPDNHAPFEKRMPLGLWHHAEIERYGFDFGRLLEILPTRLRQMFGFVTASEIDIIINAAGLAYSDQWGHRPTRDLAKRAKKWKMQGKKLIMLPQAFGPFTSSAIKSAMIEVVQNADLIFARDKYSFAHLTNLVGHHDKIKLAPDFTNRLVPASPGEIPEGKNLVAIVPNARMTDKTPSEVSLTYERFLKKIINQLAASGLTPFF